MVVCRMSQLLGMKVRQDGGSCPLKGILPGGGLGGEFLGSLLLSQTSFILIAQGVYLQQDRQIQAVPGNSLYTPGTAMAGSLG